MNLSSLVMDNITELLVKIIEFIQIRKKVLTKNMNNLNSPGFIPKDLATEEFSELLKNAIDEHVRNHRLVLCDTKNIKFGVGGNFETKAVIDKYAKELFEENQDKYIELQIDKLLENSLNQRVAAELLKQRQEMISTFE